MSSDRSCGSFYRFINARLTDSHGIQPALKTASGIVCTDADKAKCLNDYFASVLPSKVKAPFL